MKLAALILLACTVPAAPALAAEKLDVSASTLLPVVEPGGFGEVTCTIANRTDATLRVFFEGHLRFEGTGRTRVLGPSVLEVPAGLTFEIAPLFLVPDEAEPGDASFTCRAHVAGPLRAMPRDTEPQEDRSGEASVTFQVE